MTKKINLNVVTCSKCPYRKHNSYYSRGVDSGHDCKKANRRIIDDNEYSNSNNPKAQFRYDPETDEHIGDPNIKIPNWCPL
jgi:hypothetical protein